MMKNIHVSKKHFKGHNPIIRWTLHVRFFQIFLFAALIFQSNSTYADWRATTQSGDWTNTATWGGLSVPVNGDQISIGAGHTVNYYGNLSKTAGQLEINGGRLNIVGNLTLGSSVTSGTSSLGGQLFVYGDYTQQSNFQINGGAIIVVMNNMNASGIINVNNGLLVVNGNLTKSNSVTVDANSNIVVTGNYTSNAGDTWINSGNAFVFNTISCTGSNCNLIKDEVDWNATPAHPGYPYLSNGSMTFSTNDTFIVPEGVTIITVQAWGGGGGGGAGYLQGQTRRSGGGGGGGAFTILSNIDVTPSQTYPVTIGSGGSTSAQNGEASHATFGAVTITALGGSGGTNATSTGQGTSGSGGAGGTAGTFSGGVGANGTAGYGGGGGSSAGTNSNGNNATDQAGGIAVTNGGAGGNGNSADGGNGFQGSFPGGGGGGGRGSGGIGGAGANGQIIISWTSCTAPTAPTTNAGSNASCTQLTANWAASSGATSYRLDVSTVSNFVSFVAGYNNLDVGTATSHTITGLSASTTYYYRVRAVNSCGNSGNSGTITYATTPVASVASVSGATPLCVGATATYTANSVVLSGGTGAWSSSNTAVATVNSSGLVTAIGTGTCNISYTITSGCGGTVSASQPVTVNALPVSPNSTGASICIGSTATLSASGAVSGEFYKWYDAATAGTLLKTSTNNTDNTYTTFVLGSTTNFWVSILNAGGCESSRTQVTATYPAVSNDLQTPAGSNSWIGHVYDGTNFGVAFDGNFTNYYGNYTEAETFDQSYGGDAVCFNITSNSVARSILTTTFSVRYRMNSTKKGLYIVDLGSDDGSRLTVDGTLVFNNWVDQSFTSRPRVLISLNGASSLVYDFNENGGQNQVVFQNLIQVLSNTLNTNTTQNICLGNTGSAISGDVYGTLPTGITLSGTGYQWAYSNAATGPWTDISGATAATYSPSSAAAPFNAAGTYYLIRKAILSSTNNVSPNPYVATNESNVATITVTAIPTATISYAGTPFCRSVGTAQPVTISGTGAYTGGTYSSTAGLSLNTSTGAITPGTSTAGTYTVTYTIPATGGCASVPVTTSVTITALPVATFSYAGTPYCSNAANPSPTFSGGGVAGTFSSTAGLNFVSTATGQVNLATSTAGTYTVTNTIAASGGCALVSATSSITITTLPAATISYSGTPFCKSVATPQAVTRTGTAGGTYTASPAGLTINASTGDISPSTSTAGVYTVTYTLAAANGCGIVTATASVTVTAVPTATISYADTPFCRSVATAQPVTISGTGAYTGGTYSSTAGLRINTSTGEITPSTSTAGIYTVTYTIPASGGCAAVPVTTSVTITTLPVATFSYTGTPYCSNAANPSPTFSGGGVAGTFSSTAGLNFVSTSTGQVNLSTSTAGTYTVTSTIAASGGCAAVSATSSITITTLPAATISYAGTPFCKSVATAQAVIRAGTTGGTYTASPAGLTINASTGDITPSTSTAGVYTVTYTLAAANGCGIVTATASVIITAVPTATISYAGTPFCKSVSTAQPVTINGTGAYTGGTYSSTAGLTINSGTGAITPSTSTAGTYTVNYTIPVSGGCAAVPVTTTVTINTLPVATFSYTGTPYCSNAANPSPTFSGGGVSGTFSSTAGLNFVSTTTGQVNLATSTPGTYTVTNTIAALGGCAAVSANSSITVNPNLPVSVSIAAVPSGAICEGTSVTFTATPTNGGTPTYIWKKGGVVIPSETNSTYTTNTLANNDAITCVLTSNATCATGSPATSNTVTMVVNTTSLGGTATASVSQVCYSTSTTLTLAGSVGNIQWQTNASGSWADISGATGVTYNTPNLITATSYRAVVISGVCSSTTSNEVTISIDNVPPVFTGCPVDITKDIDSGYCSALVSWTAPTANDVCDGSRTVSVSLGSGGTFSTGSETEATITVGETTVTYTATDAAGNIATCTFKITVKDLTAPTITCPPSQTVLCLSDIPVINTLPLFIAAGGTYTDNAGSDCNMVTVSYSDVQASNVVTRTYTLTDGGSNGATCNTQQFTILAPTVEIATSSTPCVGSGFIISSTVTTTYPGTIYYRWDRWDGSTWVEISGATGSSLNANLVSFADKYRVRIAQSDFTSGYCDFTSNELEFVDTPPTWITTNTVTRTAFINQIVGGAYTTCSATPATLPALELTDLDVTDLCTTNFEDLTITKTIGGNTTTGDASGISFTPGTTTAVTYTITDQQGKILTITFDVVLKPAPAPITMSYANVSVAGTGIAPNQCADYRYFVTEDALAPEAGYTYTWKIFTGSGTVGTQLSSGTHYTIDNSTSPYHAASVKISWPGNLLPGIYTIEVIKAGSNGCDSRATLQINLQNSFNLFVKDPGNDCKGESLGSKIINWEVGRNCGTASYSFTYVIAAGEWNTLGDAQAHAITGMPVTITNISDNPKIIYQTVDYGTGGDFYTTQVFTLFIYNQLDGNGQADINSTDNFHHFYLKAIPNTSPISTD